MAKRVQRRRGTTTEHSTFTGAVGEITVDLDKDTVVVHDGATVGGFPLAREDLYNVDLTNKIGVVELNLQDGIPGPIFKNRWTRYNKFCTLLMLLQLLLVVTYLEQ